MKKALKATWDLILYGFGVNGFYISFKVDRSNVDHAIIALKKTKRKKLKVEKADREIEKEEIKRRISNNI